MQVSVDKCIFKWSDISRLDIAQYYCSLFNIYKIHFPFSGGLQNYYSYGKKRGYFKVQYDRTKISMCVVSLELKSVLIYLCKFMKYFMLTSQNNANTEM